MSQPVNTGELAVVGARVRKVDGLELVTGQARFTADLRFPGLLYGYARRAGVPAGKLGEVDPSPALRLPGVVVVLLAGDIPGPNLIGILPPFDQPLLATGEVRYAGESLALVVAVSREAARRGAAAVRRASSPGSRSSRSSRRSPRARTIHPTGTSPAPRSS